MNACPICGLVVAEGHDALHEEWHRKLDRVAEVADAYGAGGLTWAMQRWASQHALEDLVGRTEPVNPLDGI